MRHYKRKTDRGNTPADVLQRAVNLVVNSGSACRTVAREFDVPHVTPRRYCQKQGNNGNDFKPMRYGYFNNRAVFDDDQELMLVAYLKKAASLYYGLSTTEVRKFSYEYAARLQKQMPAKWADNEMAGPDWLSGLLKRYGDISLRRPEATAVGRTSSFNKHNVGCFFLTASSVSKTERSLLLAESGT